MIRAPISYIFTFSVAVCHHLSLRQIHFIGILWPKLIANYSNNQIFTKKKKKGLITPHLWNRRCLSSDSKEIFLWKDQIWESTAALAEPTCVPVLDHSNISWLSYYSCLSTEEGIRGNGENVKNNANHL